MFVESNVNLMSSVIVSRAGVGLHERPRQELQLLSPVVRLGSTPSAGGPEITRFGRSSFGVVLALFAIASVVRTEAASAQIVNHGIEVCKSGPAGTVASFTITELPGTPRPFLVPAGLCQPFGFLSPTDVIIEERALPGLQVSDIFVTPTTAEIAGTRDVPAGIIGVRSTAFNVFAPEPTRVVFHNTPEPPGTVRVCKQGASLPAGTAFSFTSSVGTVTTPFTLMRDQCGDFSFPVGTRVIIDENPPAGFAVSQITVDPVSAEAQGRDAVEGVVAVTVGSGLVLVTYTNAPVAAAPGAVSICKVAGAGVASGTLFPFTATSNGLTTPLSVAADGGCATVPYPVGSHVTIDENPPAGFAVSQIVVGPAGDEVGGTRDVDAGVVGVTVGSSMTSVTYTNTVAAAAPGVLRVCKLGADLPVGTPFPFTATAAGSSGSPFMLLPDQCGDFSFPAGTLVGLDENPPTGFEVSRITVDPPGAEVEGTRSVAAGLIGVTVGSGLVTVNYTNTAAVAVPGALSVCKTAATGVASGTLFTFSVTSNGMTTPLAVAAGGGCATVPYPVGNEVTIDETAAPGFTVSDIDVTPAGAEVTGTRDLALGVVGVRVGPGTTTVRMTNVGATAAVVPFTFVPPSPVPGPVIFRPPLALTGAEIDHLVQTGLRFCLLGAALVVASRRWRRPTLHATLCWRPVERETSARDTAAEARTTPARCTDRPGWQPARRDRAPPPLAHRAVPLRRTRAVPGRLAPSWSAWPGARPPPQAD